MTFGIWNRNGLFHSRNSETGRKWILPYPKFGKGMRKSIPWIQELLLTPLRLPQVFGNKWTTGGSVETPPGLDPLAIPFYTQVTGMAHPCVRVVSSGICITNFFVVLFSFWLNLLQETNKNHNPNIAENKIQLAQVCITRWYWSLYGGTSWCFVVLGQ